MGAWYVQQIVKMCVAVQSAQNTLYASVQKESTWSPKR